MARPVGRPSPCPVRLASSPPLPSPPQSHPRTLTYIKGTPTPHVHPVTRRGTVTIPRIHCRSITRDSEKKRHSVSQSVNQAVSQSVSQSQMNVIIMLILCIVSIHSDFMIR